MFFAYFFSKKSKVNYENTFMVTSNDKKIKKNKIKKDVCQDEIKKNVSEN